MVMAVNLNFFFFFFFFLVGDGFLILFFPLTEACPYPVQHPGKLSLALFVCFSPLSVETLQSSTSLKRGPLFRYPIRLNKRELGFLVLHIVSSPPPF